MKKVLKSSFLLLALLSIVFVSCKKDYPEPPIQDLPIGEVYTIEDILNMEPGTVFTEDASVYGIITADEQSGNLYKAAFMQDPKTGAALELHLDAVSGVRIGDSIRVYLKDVTYSLYNNLPQLSNFEADGHIVILANNKDIEPAKATIAEINQGKYLAGLVRLENVKFTEQNTFADPTTYGNRTLIDALDPSNNVIVRTSNYANFANDSLPQGTGNLVAIASVYNSTWQLYIRSAKELEFEDYVPGGNSGLPYFQDFATSFGTYTTYSVAGDQEWEIDYNTAKMTGHVGSNNYVNEDWLLSAPVTLTGVDHVKVCVNYAAQYQNSNTEDVTLQISKNYKAGSDPLSADWTQMPVTYPNTANWSDFQTVETSLDEFLGETVTVAIKFVSSEKQSRTIEVKYILVQEGEPGNGPTPPGPGGDGEVQSLPYTQSFASDFGTYITKDVLGSQSWEIDYSTAKITGHVGGNPGENFANEDWLISSPVAVTGVSEAKVSVNYAAQYKNSNARDVTLQVSTDYVFGNDPATATWTEMSSTYPNTANWNDFQTVETSLNDFIGQNVTVAIKFTSTDSESRTIEIKSITVQEGHANGGGDTPPTPPTPGEGEGNGTQDDPYNVAAGIGLQSEEPIAWVRGYIVGAVKSGNSTVDDNSQINWSAPFDLATNVVIADDANCREITQCIIVNLPAGKPLRTQVNLMDNPGNLGKLLSVKGKLRKYFGQAGLRDSGGTEADFMLEGSTPPGPVGTVYFDEGLVSESSYGKFLSYSVTGDEEWHFDSRYGAVMSGYADNASHANEDWFISAPIDLSNSTNPVLVFDHARGPEQSMNVGVAEGYYTVWAISEYDGTSSPSSLQWTELTGVVHPTVKWQYVSSGELSIPSALRGPNTRIAFKYLCTNQESATWEIKNVKVKEQ